MTEMKTKIAAGLERAFATSGFAEPSVEDLRSSAGVSLRTLYKYAPSREAMVHMAMEHRHRRYMEHLFADPSPETAQPLARTLDRVADWMQNEASHGCLFHAAVAAAPQDTVLRELLERHKAEVAQLAARKAGGTLHGSDLLLVLEGLTQAWSLSGNHALDSAKRMVSLLEAASLAGEET